MPLIPFILIFFQGDTGTKWSILSNFLVLLREGLSLKFFFIALSFIVIFMMGIILEKTILYTIFTIFLIIVGLSIKDFKRIINSSIFFVLVILVINGQDF